MNTNKSVTIDFLYLDTSICTRCQDTETNLDESLDKVTELLTHIGFEVILNKKHIDSETQAIEEQFISSPTIRVNGNDIQMEVLESHCSTCSSLTSDAAVDCRVWTHKGKQYSAPPKELIIDSILREIYQTETPETKNNAAYSLPENLKEYFAKKDQLCANVKQEEKTACCDASACC